MIKAVRLPSMIQNEIETARQSLEHAHRSDDYQNMWSQLKVLLSLYEEMSELHREVLDLRLPQLLVEPDKVFLITEANQDGEVITEQQYHERLLRMSPLDTATHTAIPVAPEAADALEFELNTLKQGFAVINSLAKKRA